MADADSHDPTGDVVTDPTPADALERTADAVAEPAAAEAAPEPDLGLPDLGLLEREGDIAADYLEALLDIADLDGDIDIDVEGERAAVSIVGADLSKLVGDDGGTLEALQELTRLAVIRETGSRSQGRASN